jgi:putative copper export protein
LSTALQRRREHGVAITGIEGCCACAVSGHAAVAPPSSVTNRRRFLDHLVGAAE